MKPIDIYNNGIKKLNSKPSMFSSDSRSDICETAAKLFIQAAETSDDQLFKTQAYLKAAKAYSETDYQNKVKQYKELAISNMTDPKEKLTQIDWIINNTQYDSQKTSFIQLAIKMCGECKEYDKQFEYMKTLVDKSRSIITSKQIIDEYLLSCIERKSITHIKSFIELLARKYPTDNYINEYLTILIIWILLIDHVEADKQLDKINVKNLRYLRCLINSVYNRNVDNLPYIIDKISGDYLNSSLVSRSLSIFTKSVNRKVRESDFR